VDGVSAVEHLCLRFISWLVCGCFEIDTPALISYVILLKYDFLYFTDVSIIGNKGGS
jgi:hypothetical protein